MCQATISTHRDHRCQYTTFDLSGHVGVEHAPRIRYSIVIYCESIALYSWTT